MSKSDSGGAVNRSPRSASTRWSAVPSIPPAPAMRYARDTALPALLVPARAPVGELCGVVLDLVPPPLVVAVPADGLAKALLEVHDRLPSELALRLLARDRIA